MRRDVQAIVLILVGGAVLRITIGDTFLNYVQEPMRPWLLLSGGILVVLGVLALIDSIRKGRAAGHEATPHDEPHEHDDGHGHGAGGPRAAWLLLLPVLAIFLIAPPALGAYAAARDVTNSAPTSEAKAPPLPPGDPAQVTVAEYVGRAVWDDGLTLVDRTVEMTGFVTPDPAGGWWISRMAVACCAADAIASKVKVLDAPDLPADTWVTITGRWVPGGGTKTDTAIPLIEVIDLVEVPQPRNPYE
ncbi:MAG: TIGR03943 family putative permease subunit [Candidatus Nanopelagicales bacterium]|jgi:uncharacterized repeat protein (TIGR03943 family)